MNKNLMPSVVYFGLTIVLHNHLKKMMLQGKSSTVPALWAERNLSKTRKRRRSRIPGCRLPSAKVLPKKSTSELGRRIVQILVCPPTGPSATSSGSLLLPISFLTVANSAAVMVAVRIQIGANFAMCTFTPKMFLRRPGRILAQCPSSPCFKKLSTKSKLCLSPRILVPISEL